MLSGALTGVLAAVSIATASPATDPSVHANPKQDQGPPPICRNYELETPWGRYTTDVRPVGSDLIGIASWALFFNDPNEAPGEYAFLENVNGQPIGRRVQLQNKDDNLHGAFYRVTDGKVRYNSGDTIHVDILHESDTGNTYITPLNSCVVP